MMKSFWQSLILGLALSLGPGVPAIVRGETLPLPSPHSEMPQATGAEIIRRSNQLIDKISDQKNKVILSLIEKTGAKEEIVAWRYWKNYHNQGGFSSKTIIFPESSSDLPSAALLIWDYATPGKDPDTWVYFPGPPRFKPCFIRSVCQGKHKAAFIGSDLTFGDASQRQVDEDSHQRVGEESFRGVVCFVVESVLKAADSVYSKKRTWISERDYAVQKIDYYDRTGKILKRQTIDWQTLKGTEGDLYAWKKSEIVNLQNEHQTILEISDVDVNIGLVDNDFTEHVLGKSRKFLEEHLEARRTRKGSGER